MQLTEKDIKRFWGQVRIVDPDECWNYQGSIMSDGYGVIGIKYKIHRAHRVAWTIINGEIPTGMCICHHCDNRLCCNWTHLFIGKRADNNLDKKRKGRTTKGILNKQAKLNEMQVLEIRNLRQSGMVLRRIAKIYKVSFQLISLICQNKLWQHI